LEFSKFNGDRSRKLGDFALIFKKVIVPIPNPNFLERPPNFWDLHFLSATISDHLAKFHGDRPRELGDFLLKNRRRRKGKYTSSRTYRPSASYGKPKLEATRALKLPSRTVLTPSEHKGVSVYAVSPHGKESTVSHFVLGPRQKPLKIA